MIRNFIDNLKHIRWDLKYYKTRVARIRNRFFIDRYKEFWEEHEKYIIAPIDGILRDDYWALIQREDGRFLPFIMTDTATPIREIYKRMVEAGVEIDSRSLVIRKYSLLWGDDIDTYLIRVLKTRDGRTAYEVVDRIYNQSMLITTDKNDEVIKNMMANGAEVVHVE